MINRKISMMLIAIIAISLAFFTGCKEKEFLDSNEDLIIDEVNEDEVITPIHIDVTLKNGALNFEDHEALREALLILDDINLASRKAWEESIGFKSIRTLYEEALKQFLNEEPIEYEKYENFIDFSGDFPRLKNNSKHTSSVLSLDNIYYVWGGIGTFRLDGSYWVAGGSKEKLDEVLVSKQADFDNGVLVYTFGNDNTLENRSCTTFQEEEFFESGVINNGTNRGSSRLTASFHYVPLASSASPDGSVVWYRVYVYMNGHSYRRNQSGTGWKSYRADHTFSWDFEVSQGSTITSFSGGDFHANNYDVQRRIDIFDDYKSSSWVASNFFQLHEVYTTPHNGNGTFHTTNFLSPDVVDFGCD